MPINILSDARCRTAQAGEHHDGGGLYLDVKPSGTKSWKYRWSAPPKRPKMGLGPYPVVTLAEARVKAERCRKLVARGIDPREHKTEVRKPETLQEATSKYFALKKSGLKGEGEAGKWLSPIDNHILPKLGDRAVTELTLDDLVGAIEPIWKKDTGRKALDRISQVLVNAKARDPEVMSGVDDIKASIKSLLPHIVRTTENHPALPWEQVPELWLSLDDSVTNLGFKFYLLNLPRTSNVTKMKWSDVDWSAKIWDIPPLSMKQSKPFAAPLSTQSVAILRTAKIRFKSDRDFVFPSLTAWKKGHISENTWAKWMKSNDWKADDGRFAVPHGFRASFGTWCGDNQICPKEMQKRCIQHKVESDEDAAYLRSKLLPERLSVMQRWADYVTSLEVAASESQRKRAARLEALDLPAEPPGKDGFSRTQREVEEWLREDDVERIQTATGER